jgi:hypothetical protein
MTKRATIISTVILTLVVLAWIKDPATGQSTARNLFEWMTNW